jgi:hypothetical protein
MGRGVCAEIIAPKELDIANQVGVDDKIGLDSGVPTIVRLKARLTGNFQRGEYDYLILSPRLRTQTFRLLIIIHTFPY